MGGLASSAMYLATSLASGPPPVVSADPVLVVVDASAASPALRTYVIVDLPAHGAARSSGGAIGLEIEAMPSIKAVVPEPSAAVEADVIASHDQRIGLLRARIDILRQDKAETATIATLDGRLRRAKAARQLAVARVALAQCAAACAPKTVAIVHRSITVSSVPVTASAPLKRRSQSSPFPRSELAQASPNVAPLLVEAPLAYPVQQPVLEYLDIHAERLGRARLLLAKARAALTEEPPSIQLAGLWHWEGSERWSLSAGPQRST